MVFKEELAKLKWTVVARFYCLILSVIITSCLIVIFTVVVYGHYFICFDKDCQPLSNALIQFQEIAVSLSDQSLSDQSLSDQISPDQLSFYEFVNTDNNNYKINKSLIDLSLIIGQRRGGTSWLRSILMKHKQVSDLGEILRIWYNTHCSQFAFLLNKTNECDHISMINAINHNYLKAIKQYFSINKNHIDNELKTVTFIGKIQIEQLSSKNMKILIKYIFVNNIKIIHFQRGATIASYISYSFDEIERLSNLNGNNFDDLVERNRSIAKNKKLSQQAIYIQPSLAIKYIIKIEKKHQEFRKFITMENKQNEEKLIDYIHIYYEYLMDSVHSNNNIYLKMLQSFLEIDPSINSTKITNYKREHPLPCYQKIQNWKQLKLKLNSLKSISRIACERSLS